MEDHDRSDAIGEAILGEQPNAIFRDAAASSFNNLRTQVLMQKSDLSHRSYLEKNISSGIQRWMQVLQ